MEDYFEDEDDMSDTPFSGSASFVEEADDDDDMDDLIGESRVPTIQAPRLTASSSSTPPASRSLSRLPTPTPQPGKSTTYHSPTSTCTRTPPTRSPPASSAATTFLDAMANGVDFDFLDESFDDVDLLRVIVEGGGQGPSGRLSPTARNTRPLWKWRCSRERLFGGGRAGPRGDGAGERGREGYQ